MGALRVRVEALHNYWRWLCPACGASDYWSVHQDAVFFADRHARRYHRVPEVPC